MRHLTLGEVVALHRAVIESTGGAAGIRELEALASALAQPRAAFAETYVHVTVPAQAAALAYALALNHPFIDGTKCVAHAAMEVFLTLNGFDLVASADEQEQLLLTLAAGRLSREELEHWLDHHTYRVGG